MADFGEVKRSLDNMVDQLEWFIPGLDTIPYFIPFLTQIKEFKNLYSSYCKPDKFGKYPTLSPSMIKSLMEKITQIKSMESRFKYDVFLFNTGLANPYSLLNMYHFYKVFDFDLYKAYQIFDYADKEMKKDDKLNKTFEDIAEEWGGLAVSVVSGAIRNPVDMKKVNAGGKVKITLSNQPGEDIDGYFQKDTNFNINDSYKKLLDDYIEKYPELKNFFNVLTRGVDFKDLANRLKDLPQCFDENKGSIDVNKVTALFNKGETEAIYNEIMANKDNKNIIIPLFDLSRKVNDLNVKYKLNVEKIGIDEVESLTLRTTAVTDVAKMIGAINVVPEATKMVIDPNVKGVFEVEADGIEISKIKYNSEIRGFADSVFKTSEAIYEMSKLQVLDFITGNVDRDINKLFLKFDKSNTFNPKLVGIQSIGNKASFTTKDVKFNESVGNMPSLANLKVIDKTMATNILIMDESSFKSALKNNNLSEEAKEKAWKRCQDLQTVIKNSLDNKKPFDNKNAKDINDVRIKIIDGMDWNKVKYNELANEKEPNNYFNMLGDISKELKKDMKLNNEFVKDHVIADYALTSEYNSFKTQFKVYAAKLNEVDNPFFSFNKQTKGIITAIQEQFKDVKELGPNETPDATAIGKMTEKFVEVQKQCKMFLAEKEFKLNGKEPNAKDSEIIKVVNAMNEYMDQKLQKLFIKYGDLMQTEIDMMKNQDLTGKRFMNVVMTFDDSDRKIYQDDERFQKKAFVQNDEFIDKAISFQEDKVESLSQLSITDKLRKDINQTVRSGQTQPFIKNEKIKGINELDKNNSEIEMQTLKKKN